MKKPTILSFICLTTHKIWTLNQDTGDYQNGGNKRHLYSFFDGQHVIHSIMDKSAPTLNHNQKWILGDKVQTPHYNEQKIVKILVLNASTGLCVQFTLENTSTILIQNAKKAITTIIPNVEAIKKLETKILTDFNHRTLKFSVFRRRKTENFDTFMSKFAERNAQNSTIWSDTKICQTTSGRRRSLGDIFMICRYYYPTITLAEVLTQLYAKFGSSICSTIHKRVFYIRNGHDIGTDEYNYPLSFYRDMK